MSHVPATRAHARVALVTCSELPNLLEGDCALALPALAELGIAAEAAVWDDPSVDWAAYDLVVIRSPWDYQGRRDEFLTWARSVPRLLNPVPVIEWNTDKRYLAELVAAGIPVIPTTFVAPGGPEWTPPAGEYVIKPSIGAGSRDTGRYGPSDAQAAIGHMRQLLAAGRVTMVQPYLSEVDTYGETALIYFADKGVLTFSHAIRKGPMLTGPFEGRNDLFKDEVISARTPTEAELAIGAKVAANLPDGLLYARVDLIPGADGVPHVIEVELTEPSVFLGHHPDAAANYARAIAGVL